MINNVKKSKKKILNVNCYVLSSESCFSMKKQVDVCRNVVSFSWKSTYKKLKKNKLPVYMNAKRSFHKNKTIFFKVNKISFVNFKWINNLKELKGKILKKIINYIKVVKSLNKKSNDKPFNDKPLYSQKNIPIRRGNSIEEAYPENNYEYDYNYNFDKNRNKYSYFLRSNYHSLKLKYFLTIFYLPLFLIKKILLFLLRNCFFVVFLEIYDILSLLNLIIHDEYEEYSRKKIFFKMLLKCFILFKIFILFYLIIFYFLFLRLVILLITLTFSFFLIPFSFFIGINPSVCFFSYLKKVLSTLLIITLFFFFYKYLFTNWLLKYLFIFLFFSLTFSYSYYHSPHKIKKYDSLILFLNDSYLLKLYQITDNIEKNLIDMSSIIDDCEMLYHMDWFRNKLEKKCFKKSTSSSQKRNFSTYKKLNKNKLYVSSINKSTKRYFHKNKPKLFRVNNIFFVNFKWLNYLKELKVKVLSYTTKVIDNKKVVNVINNKKVVNDIKLTGLSKSDVKSTLEKKEFLYNNKHFNKDVFIENILNDNKKGIPINKLQIPLKKLAPINNLKEFIISDDKKTISFFGVNHKIKSLEIVTRITMDLNDKLDNEVLYFYYNTYIYVLGIEKSKVNFSFEIHKGDFFLSDINKFGFFNDSTFFKKAFDNASKSANKHPFFTIPITVKDADGNFFPTYWIVIGTSSSKSGPEGSLLSKTFKPNMSNNEVIHNQIKPFSVIFKNKHPTCLDGNTISKIKVKTSTVDDFLHLDLSTVYKYMYDMLKVPNTTIKNHITGEEYTFICSGHYDLLESQYLELFNCSIEERVDIQLNWFNIFCKMNNKILDDISYLPQEEYIYVEEKDLND